MQIRHRIRFLGRRYGINVEFRKGRAPSHSLFNLQVELTPRTQAETIQLRWCTGVCSYWCNRVHCYHVFPTLCSVMSHWYLKSCTVEVSILLAHMWQTIQTRDFFFPLGEPVVKHWLAHRLIKLFRQVKSSSKTKERKKRKGNWMKQYLICLGFDELLSCALPTAAWTPLLIWKRYHISISGLGLWVRGAFWATGLDSFNQHLFLALHNCYYLS